MRGVDVLCLSHLRWDLVFQRPQHLMTRAARTHRVFYVEEPLYGEGDPRIETRFHDGVCIAVPRLPEGTPPDVAESMQRLLLDELCREHRIEHFLLWFYTPMALVFAHHLAPAAIVFDCMDELSAFQGAPAGLLARESILLQAADLVFTGGQSIYEAKRDRHSDIHAFPSSVDVPHFAQARTLEGDPDDQRAIPRPRVGYFGVIDERMDIALVDEIARLRPDLHLVMVGPVVKIDPGILPRRPNIHWLGGKSYADLPRYIAGWDVAMMPFARNESTRYISPTKTPEYLAAGRPVVSTSIRDVVRPYGDLGLARIADEPRAFIAAIDAALGEAPDQRQAAADRFLADLSWDRTWREMEANLDRVMRRRRQLGATATRSTTDAAALGYE